MGLFGHDDDDKKDEQVVPAGQGAGQAPVDGGVAGVPTPAVGGSDDTGSLPAAGGDAAQAPGAESAGVPTAPVAPDGAGTGMGSEPADPAAPAAGGADAPADPAAGAAGGAEEPKKW